jgi:polyphosphate kinase 2 (PPK2 family)
VDGGTQLIKVWLEVGQDEQEKRFKARINDPLSAMEIKPDGSRVLPALVCLFQGA